MPIPDLFRGRMTIPAICAPMFLVSGPKLITSCCKSGVVFSDIIHAYHARKAIDAGVDGIIAVASGAGGHAGTQRAFSLVRELREFACRHPAAAVVFAAVD